MKTAVFPGSFRPWHEGHKDVLDKALKTFDKVIIMVGSNPEKSIDQHTLDTNGYKIKAELSELVEQKRVQVVTFNGLFVDFLKFVKVDAVVKGIRSSIDFEYEKNIQYWNEDLGIEIPTFYVISDRKLIHISSSAIRALDKFKGGMT